MSKKLLSFIVIVGILLTLSFTSYAANGNTFNPTMENKQNRISSLKNLRKNTTKILSTASLAASLVATLVDAYEPNDSIDTAATMSTDTIYANIGYDGDMDFYVSSFYANQDAAISLRNIPSGCDYDLYLCDMDGNILAASENTGTADEIILGTINVAGNYLIAVVPYSGFNDSQNYKLYAGDRVKTSTGSYWSNSLTKLSISSTNVYTASASCDLRNESSIPSTAKITSFYLNGSYTGNFGNAALQLSSSSSSWFTADLSDKVNAFNTQSPNQLWYVHWKVQTIFQSPASWTPQLLINYTYTHNAY